MCGIWERKMYGMLTFQLPYAPSITVTGFNFLTTGWGTGLLKIIIKSI